MNKWDTEPNYLRWYDAATGLRCAIVRVPRMGHLCGYVKLPHGVKISAGKAGRMAVHGGVTFNGKHRYYRLSRGRWVGFDCAHAFDVVPMFHERWAQTQGAAYRDIEFVKQQCTMLAEQISKRIKNGGAS